MPQITMISQHARMSFCTFACSASLLDEIHRRQAEQTIYALSSGSGRAGIAVIRISGPFALECLRKIMDEKQKLPPTRMACVRRLLQPVVDAHSPDARTPLDNALVLSFRGPQSFTGEDMVELHLHGSASVIAGTLEALQQLGLQAAAAGDFTRRAFANNKLDLTEVEGLADLLDAETEVQRVQALQQMGGALSDLYENWRSTLLHSLAHLEAVIDFADEEDDVDGQKDTILAEVGERVRELSDAMQTHLDDAHRGELVRSGVNVALVGAPNAGKSSLLNMLAKRPAAIVSPEPGTTRDVVDVTLNLAGFPVRVSDTAGLRAGSNAVEREGVRRAKAVVSEAQIQLLVVDGADTEADAAGWDDWWNQHVGSLARDARMFVVVNKSDLVSGKASTELTRKCDERFEQAAQVLSLSCVSGDGVAALEKALASAVQDMLCPNSRSDGVDGLPALAITRSRHRGHVSVALAELNKAEQCMGEVELSAEHLRRCSDSLGQIVGRLGVEEILDVVFRDFCIGK